MTQVALAIIVLLMLAGAVVANQRVANERARELVAEAASAQATPAQIERPEPSAKPTKNPHSMHHHFDVRHPHKSTRPQLENPQSKPD